MIPKKPGREILLLRKPRASGDDPTAQLRARKTAA